MLTVVFWLFATIFYLAVVPLEGIPICLVEPVKRDDSRCPTLIGILEETVLMSPAMDYERSENIDQIDVRHVGRDVITKIGVCLPYFIQKVPSPVVRERNELFANVVDSILLRGLEG